MSIDDQWREVHRRLEERFPGLQCSSAGGASNLPFMLGNGFRLGLFNIDSIDFAGLKAKGKQFALASRIILPPGDILCVAVVFEGDDLDTIGARVQAVRAALQERESRPVANKVRVYLHESGIYFRMPGDPEYIDPEDESFGPPIPATIACFSDVIRETHLEPVEVAYINYLTSLLTPIPFARLDAQGETGGPAALNLAEIDFPTLVHRIRELGAQYSDDQIARYHTALNHLPNKHFVILTGISGTGKTLLAKSYSYSAFSAPSLDMDAVGFYLIPVRPEWTEPAQLLGFYDAISGVYRRTPFLDALLSASQNQHRPVFVVLDEMNLAQPEYYFSDVLSCMETGGAIRLHDFDEDQAGVPQVIPWPKNLYITGTVNVDETTRSLSPKILDRANVIDMSNVDVRDFCTLLSSREDRLANALTPTVVELLETVSAILEPYGLHFGYRTVEEIACYVAYANQETLLAADALDSQVAQKILTKLRGGPELTQALAKLSTLFQSMPKSLATIERLNRDLEHYGSFQYWT